MNKLTPHQIRIIQMLANGLCYKEIAYELKNSTSTIKNTMCLISETLEVSGMVSVVAYCFRNGLIK
jgi:DNA-binding NarL/FixJ family response regulator